MFIHFFFRYHENLPVSQPPEILQVSLTFTLTLYFEIFSGANKISCLAAAWDLAGHPHFHYFPSIMFFPCKEIINRQTPEEAQVRPGARLWWSPLLDGGNTDGRGGSKSCICGDLTTAHNVKPWKNKKIIIFYR